MAENERRRWAWACLALILALGTGLRIISFVGLWGLPNFDEFAYSHVASVLARGTYAPRAIQQDIRLGFLVPLAIAVRVGGLSDYSLAMYPFLLSIVGIGATYVLASWIFDEVAALCAALVVAIFPYDQFTASYVYPNQPAAVLSLLATISAVATHRVASVRQQCLLAALSGLLQALAISTWEGSAIALLIPLAVLAGHPWPKRLATLALFAAASLALALAEVTVFWLATGDPLFALHAIHTSYGITEQFTVVGLPFRFLRVLLSVSGVFPITILTIGAIVAMWRELLRPPGIWLLTWCLLALAFYSLTLTSLRPLRALFESDVRYLGVVFYPVCIFIGASIRTSIVPRGQCEL